MMRNTYEKDLSIYRDEELINLMKNAHIEFISKPYSDLQVKDLPHLIPLFQLMQQKGLIEPTIERLKAQKDMHLWMLRHMYRKYITFLEKVSYTAANNIEPSLLQNITEFISLEVLPIRLQYAISFRKYMHYETHSNEPEHEHFKAFCIVIYRTMIKTHDSIEMRVYDPRQFVPQDDALFTRYTAFIIRQFFNFIEESAPKNH